MQLSSKPIVLTYESVKHFLADCSEEIFDHPLLDDRIVEYPQMHVQAIKPTFDITNYRVWMVEDNPNNQRFKLISQMSENQEPKLSKPPKQPAVSTALARPEKSKNEDAVCVDRDAIRAACKTIDSDASLKLFLDLLLNTLDLSGKLSSKFVEELSEFVATY